MFDAQDSKLQGSQPLCRDAIYSYLQTCVKGKDLIGGRRVHSLVILNGLYRISVLGDHLIRLFAACGTLLESNIVFCMIPHPRIHTWHAIISAHTSSGSYGGAIRLYYCMLETGYVTPGEFVFSSVLKACGNIGAINHGRSVHSQIVVNNLESHTVLGSALVDMYSRCGHVLDARSVFNCLPAKNVVSWGAMMTGYLGHGDALPVLDFFEEMQKQRILPDTVIFLCVLNACGCIGALVPGREVHAEVIESGLMHDSMIGNALIDMYSKSGSLDEACNVFNNLLCKTVVSYSAIIGGCILLRDLSAAANIYQNMLLSDVKPNEILFLCLVKACNVGGSLDFGRLIHVHITEHGLEIDEVIGSALIDMYAKCGSLKDANRLLMMMPEKDTVLWGVLMSAHVEVGDGQMVFKLFKEMEEEHAVIDAVILLCILKACGVVNNVEQGRFIHEQIVRNRMECDMMLGNALLDMYLRCGKLDEAMSTLDRLPNRNVVTWNTVIAASVASANDEHDFSVVEILNRMQRDSIEPDTFTLSSILKTCGDLGAIVNGKQTHDWLLRMGKVLDVVIGTTLVNMYAKCGYLHDARKVLNSMDSTDVVTWNALIAGYAHNSDYKQAMDCFKELQHHGLKPDVLTYTCLLVACSHGGSVDDGTCYITSMRNEGIILSKEHLNSMTDLLARLGCLHEAKKVVATMPDIADIVSWRSLMTSCQNYGNFNIGRECFGEAVIINPYSASSYVLMSNISAEAEIEDNMKIKYVAAMSENG